MSMKNIPIYAEGFLVDMTAAEAIMKAIGIETDEAADPGHPFILHEDVLDEAKNTITAKFLNCRPKSLHCTEREASSIVASKTML